MIEQLPIAGADDPWRFKAVIEGDLVLISATFDYAGIEKFRQKLLALAAVIDAPETPIQAIAGEH